MILTWAGSTSSLIKSVGHASNIVHNLSRLREDKRGPKESGSGESIFSSWHLPTLRLIFEIIY